MANYQNILRQAHQAIADVADNADSWRAFLRSAAYTTHYAFPNQALIYSQRPGATMLADIDTWNRAAGRWVNRGARGVASLGTGNMAGNVRYLFDIKDTHPAGKAAKPLGWQITDANRYPTLQALQEKHNAESLPEIFGLQAALFVAQHGKQLDADLQNAVIGSTLEWAKPQEQTAIFANLITQSAVYMAAVRCGLGDSAVPQDAFADIDRFDTESAVLALGNAVNRAGRQIQAQLEDMPDEVITELQAKLNRQYDHYHSKFGLINSRGASLDMRDDSGYFLLCSLENLDSEGNFIGKSDMFSKRTIRAARPAERVETASEALALSVGERAGIDFGYMQQLTGKDKDTLVNDLQGVIFADPLEKNSDGEPRYYTADEYLSGDVRHKLQVAKLAAQNNPAFAVNVQALETVQPKDLEASEIAVRLGATWLAPELIKQFADELVDAPYYVRDRVKVLYIPLTGVWNVTNKSFTGGNIKATVTYGTQRANFYHILEESLNLRDVRVFDTKEDMQGNKIRVLNAAATQEAQMKQQQIEDAFKDWIWKDPTRRQMLVKEYNERFNSLRPREYDGSHILFHGMSPEITLRPHQKNAIAHILYGGNTLLAHVVGAGKTYEMVAAAMEKKRLGLCSKTLICVPNHLTEQLAGEALQLYPNANILVARRTDFEKANRKRFCAKIATGNYDIIVIGHSQFERIPLSQERQVEYLQSQIHDVISQVAQLKEERAENFTVKQMERMRKQLEKKLDKLNDQSRKDDVVTFEQLGVDSLMVDEAHAFKNLAVLSKMRNVAGISQTESQRASDLYMKCRYLDEITGSRGVVFATGTPISNSMAELFTMQRYLQRETLEQHGLSSFDAWASTFGETVTAVELAPEGYTLIGQ